MSSFLLEVVKPESSGNDTVGDVGQGLAQAKGMTSEADKRLSDAHLQLGGHHTCGLMDHVLEVRTVLQFGSQRTRRSRQRADATAELWT